MENLPSLKEIKDSTLNSKVFSSDASTDTKSEDAITIEEDYTEDIQSDEFDLQKERIPDVFTPANYILEDCILKDQKKNCFDSNVLKTHFYNQGKLSDDQVNDLTLKFVDLVSKEPNLVYIDKPSIVFGDIHGQYYDILKVLRNIDLNKETIVFVGDYVDRGSFSTEVFIYLMSLKLSYPSNVFLLRGNHESLEMTRYFSFKKECDIKYNSKFYKNALKAFKALPIAAVILKKLFCVHGGISPKIEKLDEINKINRFTEPSSESALLDILWSDPHPFYNTIEDVLYIPNKNRRCSYFYSYTAVKRFLEQNNLWCIVRGHEVQENGYTLFKEYVDGVPSVITIFSAPNYCDVYKNKGAFLKFNGEHIQIKKFKEDEHPFILPGFIDAFNWSFPFISTKLGELFLDLLSVRPSESSNSSTSEVDDDVKQAQTFTNAMSLLREEREGLNEFVDEESTELSKENLKNIITNQEDDFDEVKVKDIPNEIFKTEENLTKSMSIETVPSFSNVISKEVENSDLNELVKETQIIETDNKNIKVVVPEYLSSKKSEPSLFSCCFRKD